MHSKRARNVLISAVAATTVSMAIASTPAMAASAPVSHVRIADHFNLAAGQMPGDVHHRVLRIFPSLVHQTKGRAPDVTQVSRRPRVGAGQHPVEHLFHRGP